MKIKIVSALLLAAAAHTAQVPRALATASLIWPSASDSSLRIDGALVEVELSRFGNHIHSGVEYGEEAHACGAEPQGYELGAPSPLLLRCRNPQPNEFHAAFRRKHRGILWGHTLCSDRCRQPNPSLLERLSAPCAQPEQLPPHLRGRHLLR